MVPLVVMQEAVLIPRHRNQTGGVAPQTPLQDGHNHVWAASRWLVAPHVARRDPRAWPTNGSVDADRLSRETEDKAKVWAGLPIGDLPEEAVPYGAAYFDRLETSAKLEGFFRLPTALFLRRF